VSAAAVLGLRHGQEPGRNPADYFTDIDPVHTCTCSAMAGHQNAHERWSLMLYSGHTSATDGEEARRMSARSARVPRCVVKGGVALALTCAALLHPAVAHAGDVPVTATIAPGATGPVSWTWQFPTFTAVRDGSVVFTAPGSTTFAAQSTVPVTSDLNDATLTGCTLSNGNQTLTCAFNASPGNTPPYAGYNKNITLTFTPQVTVSATAPASTTLPAGGGTLTAPSGSSNSATVTLTASLNVATPANNATPVASPLAAGSAGILAAGAFVIYRTRRLTRKR
jgi:hypothetical protein